MIVVCFGGGTNSTAMLIGMRDRGINPDAILFADTGGEKPHTYDHITHMNRWLGKVGFPLITVVKSPNVTLETACLSNNSLPSVAYGGFKTCSQRFKTEPQDKWMNNWDLAKQVWADGRKITKMIGFDADEPQRAKHYPSDKYDNWFPLLEWDWGRDECVEAIAKAGIPQPGKSSCFYCPNSHASEVRELNANYPDLMARALAMESNADLTHIKGLGRGHYSWKNVIATDEMFDFPMPAEQCGSCYDGE